jgi:hypothetical protein
MGLGSEDRAGSWGASAALCLALWDEDQQRLVAFRDATLPSVGNRHGHHSKYDEN